MTQMAFWLALYGGWIVSELVVLIATRRRPKDGIDYDRGSLGVLWLTITGAITSGTWFGATHSPTIDNGAHWVATASVIILATALIIRWTAILSLGKYFTANVAIEAAQTVHRTGLFRFVRHPSYLGLLLIFAAIGLHTANWIALGILMIPTTIAVLNRIQIEEKALNDVFGAEYASYSRSAKRLIPGIY